MVNDPISDTMIRIYNAQTAGKKDVDLIFSKVNQNLANLFMRLGFIKSVKKVEDGKKQSILIVLNSDIKPFNIIKRVSKPGARIYVEYRKLHAPLSGRGLAIISTPNGILTHIQAKKQKVGGEYIVLVA